MLYWAAVFFVIALIAGVFGFFGIAASAAGVAKILFVVFLVLAVISLVISAADVDADRGARAVAIVAVAAHRVGGAAEHHEHRIVGAGARRGQAEELVGADALGGPDRVDPGLVGELVEGAP